MAWSLERGAEYDEHVWKCVLVPFIPFGTYIIHIQSSVEGLRGRQGDAFEDGERFENEIVPRQ